MKLKKATKSRRRKSVHKDEDDKLYSPILVVMQEKDVPVAPGYRSSSQDEQSAFDDSQTTLTNTDQVNDLIKNHISKLLNTGFHESSNENEAKNAMRLAQRLMQRHNINQALLLQERKQQNTEDKQLFKGGLVTVNLFHNTRIKKNDVIYDSMDRIFNISCTNQLQG